MNCLCVIDWLRDDKVIKPWRGMWSELWIAEALASGIVPVQVLTRVAGEAMSS